MPVYLYKPVNPFKYPICFYLPVGSDFNYKLLWNKRVRENLGQAQECSFLYKPQRQLIMHSGITEHPGSKIIIIVIIAFTTLYSVHKVGIFTSLKKYNLVIVKEEYYNPLSAIVLKHQSSGYVLFLYLVG